MKTQGLNTRENKKIDTNKGKLIPFPPPQQKKKRKSFHNERKFLEE